MNTPCDWPRGPLSGLMRVSAAHSPATPTPLPAPPHPDAALIAACAEFDRLERATLALYEGGANPVEDDHERGVVIDVYRGEQAPLVEQICAFCAATPEGHAARAGTLLLWNLEIEVDKAADPQAGWDERLLAALLRDMVPTGRAMA